MAPNPHSPFSAPSSPLTDEHEGAPPDPNADSSYQEAFADLAQIIAHRIRSLTSSIESYADLLTDAVERKEDRELVFRILEGTARIEYVLSDLLLYGKPVQPAQLPMQVDDVVRGLFSLLTEEERRLIDVEREVGEEDQVLADPKLVQQAMLAVVQNAIEALEEKVDGAVRIRMTRESGEEGAELVIAVANPGAPAAEDPEEMLFRPFYTTKAQNLGLGLPMARRIAQAHDGRLDLVRHDPSTGTCFEMAFPIQT